MLNLPPELRNNIYHLVLTSDNVGPIDIALGAIKLRTVLLRTCGQIRNEVTSIFYATNEFGISDLLGQQSEISRFAKNARDNIKHIGKLLVRVSLPKLYMKLSDLTFTIQANMDNAEIRLSLAESGVHVLDVAYSTIPRCAIRLLAMGVEWCNIELERCGHDPNTTPQNREQIVSFATYAAENILGDTMVKEAKEFARAMDIPLQSDADDDGEE